MTFGLFNLDIYPKEGDYNISFLELSEPTWCSSLLGFRKTDEYMAIDILWMTFAVETL